MNMNFEDFKQLIRNIREKIPCPQCDKKFISKNISLIGKAFNEAYFTGRCQHCTHEIIIQASFGAPRTHRSLNHSTSMKVVTPNDILDMRNFLREFNGDFISLFGKKR
jgi:hypothetical protein